MGKTTGFLEYERETPQRRPVEERVKDYFEVYLPLAEVPAGLRDPSAAVKAVPKG